MASRELPVLWRIAKGSFLNKVIILPVAFLLSAFLPIVIVPILVIGGIYLAYEGAEKIFHFLFHQKSKDRKEVAQELSSEKLLEVENAKIKSAILVDFILSLEIIILGLGLVMEEHIGMQITVVTLVAILATVGVYGIVALIVRMDDVGYRMIKSSENKTSFKAKTGGLLVKTLPWLVRTLAVVGTFAMILVAGGIFVHNVHFIHDLVHGINATLAEFLVGLVVGIVVLPIVMLVKSLFGKKAH